MKKSLYNVLGVKETASPDEIKRAYRRKAAAVHPDKGGSAELMAEANRAYACLKDPMARLNYDQTGQEQKPIDDTAIATDKLVQAFNVVLGAPEGFAGDFCVEVCKWLKMENQKMVDCRAHAKKIIKHLESRRKKIRLKRGQKSVNLWERLIDERLKALHLDVLKCEQEIKVYKMALEMLERYEGDESEVQPAFLVSADTFTNVSW